MFSILNLHGGLNFSVSIYPSIFAVDLWLHNPVGTLWKELKIDEINLFIRLVAKRRINVATWSL